MIKATNSALMREKNEKIILSLINRNPISRVAIASKTGLTKAAITIIADDLIKRGIITQISDKSTGSGVGRNPVLLSINKDSLFIVGINISRVDITVGITNLGGKILKCETFPICEPEKAFRQIKSIYDDMLSDGEFDKSKIYKISVATPGPVDFKKGIILNPPNFKAWHNVPVVHTLEALFGIEALVANVSSANAVAEKYFGSAKRTDNFLVLQVDEGIGSGIFLNDNLFDGPCELGHTSIKFDGIECECGNRGCLEKYASIPAIIQNTKYNSWQEVIDSGDLPLIKKEAEFLCSAITSANNIFNFEKIILSGDIAYKSDEIINIISNKLDQSRVFGKKVKVCPGEVSSKLQIAASIATHDFFV